MNGYAVELRKRREAANLTVRELGDRIERSATFITDFEIRRKANPPEPAMMERIASALHWPVSDQLQAWGYALDSAENRANPFDRDDPRWHYVETLKRFDLSRPEHAGILVAVAQLLQLLDAPPETFALMREVVLGTENA